MPVLKSIHPDDILKQLSELWTNMGSPEEEHGALLRACAMTLILFVDDEEDSVQLNATLGSLMREHPSRMIVVRLRAGEDELEARVFAQCWMPFGQHRQICCEQVEMTASINRLADVASIVDPLAMTDLPRVVVMRSARVVRAGAMRKILQLGDKIVVDSDRPGAPEFGELGGLLDAGHITGDLAWTRITELRALLANLIGDRKPGRIEVEYGSEEAGPEARYLHAWLESSLSSTVVAVKGGGGAENGKPCVIRIDEDVAVRLCKNGAEYDTGSLRQFASMTAGTDEELLGKEISIVVRDPVFERALNHITG